VVDFSLSGGKLVYKLFPMDNEYAYAKIQSINGDEFFVRDVSNVLDGRCP
jgi:hypothetical protein